MGIHKNSHNLDKLDTFTAKNIGDKTECVKCKHSWTIEMGDDRKYFCHNCGWDAEISSYDKPALDKWKAANMDNLVNKPTLLETTKNKPYLEVTTIASMGIDSMVIQSFNDFTKASKSVNINENFDRYAFGEYNEDDIEDLNSVFDDIDENICEAIPDEDAKLITKLLKDNKVKYYHGRSCISLETEHGDRGGVCCKAYIYYLGDFSYAIACGNVWDDGEIQEINYLYIVDQFENTLDTIKNLLPN
jgi:hypothetical protein